MDKRDIVADQEPIFASLLHHLAYYRTLDQLPDRTGALFPFWTYTQNAHLLLTVVDWCMIFGSCGTVRQPNLTHWEHVVEEQKTRDAIVDQAGLGCEQWRGYWDAMVTFRNQYAAHRDLNKRWPAPACFDHALALVFAYDDWLQEKGLRPRAASLKALYDELRGVDLDMVVAAYVSLGQCFPGDHAERIVTTTTTTTT